MHFGTALRLLRLDTGLSLRDLAGQIGVSSAYLSRVEHGHDPAPTPDRLVAIARALDLPPLLLIELADQSSPLVSSYMSRVPAAASLFLDIARRDLSSGEVARLRALVEREFPPVRTARRRAVRLRSLLSPDRLVLDLACSGMDDVIEIAAGRLGLRSGEAARAVAAQILAREGEAPSLLGSGVAVPHALGSHLPGAAALVTLRRPLREPTPDGEPVRLAVVVAGAARARSIELLAQIARLAARGLADELCGMTDPVRLLDRLEALESW
ncbi:MAG TPA: helix-turn-helix domain-containing protein [Kofleriaceae bacterium]|nr:helix-turn-helix domain-containing protein [Kofleriaceae bacterium]